MGKGAHTLLRQLLAWSALAALAFAGPQGVSAASDRQTSAGGAGAKPQKQDSPPPSDGSDAMGERTSVRGGGKRSPVGALGLSSSAQSSYTPEERQELRELEQTVRRFENQAKAYRKATRKLIEAKYEKKRDLLYNSYEKLIVGLEKEQRERRKAAIARFEAFLDKYPADKQYTPDAMFRLSELYFERSYDRYYQARQKYDKKMQAWEPEGDAPPPPEPRFHYEPTIAMMQRLITEFPEYRLVDGAYYLLGYCLGEQGEDERAVDVYKELVARKPESRFAPEVWTRIGEYYFDANLLQEALSAYKQVLGHQDSPFYDKAMYKLAWTHYRLADPERAPEEFQKAVDAFVKLLDFNERTKREGEERGKVLRPESIDYIAISYADERWGGTDKLLEYFKSIGGRPYEREVLVSLANVYFDQTRFNESIRVNELILERYPMHPDAPQWQKQIITAHERQRNFEDAAKARAVLTENYSEGAKWYQANSDDEDAIAKANELTKKSLYSAALFHHKQAQVHKEAGEIDLAQQSYERAAESYGEYLERFPHDRQLYELSYYHAESLYYSLDFKRAAKRYEQVRDSRASDKFRKEAAFSVVLSYENAIKKAVANEGLQETRVRKSSERDLSKAIEPKDIPELRLKLVAASDRFFEIAPKDERVPNVLYKAAEIFYVYDHFEEARRRFRAILERFPKHEVAEYAANLTIESYLNEKNYAAVQAFSDEMLAADKAVGGRREFKKDLVRFKSGAVFKMADKAAANGDYERAAELYLQVLEENPDTEFGDSALNNAAVAYEEIKRFESASRLYERLVNEYPDSTLADTALFRVGLNAERFFDFDKAITSYLRLVEKYEDSDRRADATYNAALALENTQQYEKAARQYQRYCKLFPERDDAPDVCFRAGGVYEKMGAPKRVVGTYRNFIRKYRGVEEHQDRVVEANLKIAQAFEELGQQRRAKRYYGRTVDAFAKAESESAAKYAARAKFAIVEQAFDEYREIQIKGGSRRQKRLLKRKAKRLQEVEKKYREVLEFKQVDWSLAALFRIGQLYQDLSESLLDAPCPPDVKGAARSMGMTELEVCGEYRLVLEERAINVEEKAVARFEATIEQAKNFKVANDWTRKTRVALNRLRRSMWPLQKEAKTHVEAVAVGTPAFVNQKGLALAGPDAANGADGGDNAPGEKLAEGEAEQDGGTQSGDSTDAAGEKLAEGEAEQDGGTQSADSPDAASGTETADGEAAGPSPSGTQEASAP